MFSSPVKDVAETKIFVRRTSPTSQVLVYSMEYQAEIELAMILPLPKLRGTGEDAVIFIDLSTYPLFFKDMARGFPEPPKSLSLPQATVAAPILRVHEVGSFEASWVPTLSDFARLDGRFRLPTEIWDQLPQYVNYGFAVFKLKAGEKSLHPMALEFQTCEPDRLFFPTVHVHNGSVKPKALFHHSLYCQSDCPGGRWQGSATQENDSLLARDFIKIDKSMGLLLPDQVVFRRPVVGLYPNEDIWVAG
jgi:hypothetical protein